MREELRQSEGRFRLIASSTPDHILVQDRDLRYSFVINPQLGLTEQDMIGKTDHDLVSKAAADELTAIKKQVLESDHPVSLELPILSPRGGQEFFSGSYVPTHGADGRVDGLIGYFTDVTERKLAEMALHRSEVRSRLLSDIAGRLLATDDPQGLINELCRDVMEYLDCQAFFNFMVDKHAGRLRLNACAGIPEEEVRKLEWLDYGVAVCGCVAREKVRIIAEDIFHTPDVRTELVKSYGIQAYCCHPLKAQERLIGTLSFGTKTRAHFTPEEVELMRIVADHVSVAMQRVQAEHDLRQSEKSLQLSNEYLEQRVRERTMDLQNITEQLERSRTSCASWPRSLSWPRSGNASGSQGYCTTRSHKPWQQPGCGSTCFRGIPSDQRSRP